MPKRSEQEQLRKEVRAILVYLEKERQNRSYESLMKMAPSLLREDVERIMLYVDSGLPTPETNSPVEAELFTWVLDGTLTTAQIEKIHAHASVLERLKQQIACCSIKSELQNIDVQHSLQFTQVIGYQLAHVIVTNPSQQTQLDDLTKQCKEQSQTLCDIETMLLPEKCYEFRIAEVVSKVKEAFDLKLPATIETMRENIQPNKILDYLEVLITKSLGVKTSIACQTSRLPPPLSKVIFSDLVLICDHQKIDIPGVIEFYTENKEFVASTNLLYLLLHPEENPLYPIRITENITRAAKQEHEQFVAAHKGNSPSISTLNGISFIQIYQRCMIFFPEGSLSTTFLFKEHKRLAKPQFISLKIDSQTERELQSFINETISMAECNITRLTELANLYAESPPSDFGLNGLITEFHMQLVRPETSYNYGLASAILQQADNAQRQLLSKINSMLDEESLKRQISDIQQWLDAPKVQDLLGIIVTIERYERTDDVLQRLPNFLRRQIPAVLQYISPETRESFLGFSHEISKRWATQQIEYEVAQLFSLNPDHKLEHEARQSCSLNIDSKRFAIIQAQRWLSFAKKFHALLPPQQLIMTELLVKKMREMGIKATLDRIIGCATPKKGTEGSNVTDIETCNMISDSLFRAFDRDRLINELLASQAEGSTYCRESSLSVRMLISYMTLSINMTRGKLYETMIQEICGQFSQQLSVYNISVTKENSKVVVMKTSSNATDEAIERCFVQATSDILQLLNTEQIHHLFQKMIADLCAKTEKTETSQERNPKQQPQVTMGSNIITCMLAILLSVITPVIVNLYNETKREEFLLLSFFVQSMGKIIHQQLPSCLQSAISYDQHTLLFTVLANFYPNNIIPDTHRAAVQAYLAAPIKRINQQLPLSPQMLCGLGSGTMGLFPPSQQLPSSPSSHLISALAPAPSATPLTPPPS